MPEYFPVLYKGYFVPVDVTDCPPLTVAPTKAPSVAPSAQSWGDAPARIAANSKPAKPIQQNTDVEVFDSGRKTTMPISTTTEKSSPNINIEIHNVFSFGTTNNSSLPSRNEETDSKISVSQHDKNHSNPPVIYA